MWCHKAKTEFPVVLIFYISILTLNFLKLTLLLSFWALSNFSCNRSKSDCALSNACWVFSCCNWYLPAEAFYIFSCNTKRNREEKSREKKRERKSINMQVSLGGFNRSISDKFCAWSLKKKEILNFEFVMLKYFKIEVQRFWQLFSFWAKISACFVLFAIKRL